MIDCFFSQKGFMINENQLKQAIGLVRYKSLLARFTLKRSKSIGNRQYSKIAFLFKKTRINHIVYVKFARFLFLNIRNAIKDLVLLKPENKIPLGILLPDSSIKPGPVLDPNQEIISQKIDSIFSEKRQKLGLAGLTLVLNTGLGKTYISCKKIRDIQRKTLIIVPNSTILENWRDTLTICFPDLKIGEYSGKKKQDGEVVIMIINSALKPEFEFKNRKIPASDYFQKFGFVIYDEIHNYVSDTRRELFWKTNFYFSLGLTATPDENAWKLDCIFEKHAGGILRASSLENYNPKQIIFKGSVIPIYYKGSPEYTKKLTNPGTGWTSHTEMVRQFCSDPNRNKIITDLLVKLWNEKRNVFVFFKTRDYADKLADLLSKKLEVDLNPQKDVVVLMGGADSSDQNRAMKSSIVFTTYKFGKEGISIPQMDTIIFATPRVAKMRQIIGRILRKSGDSSIERQIYDIVDVNTKIGKDEFCKRKKIFKETSAYDFKITDPVILNSTF